MPLRFLPSPSLVMLQSGEQLTMSLTRPLNLQRIEKPAELQKVLGNATLAFASKCHRLSSSNQKLSRILVVSCGGVLYLMDKGGDVKETTGLQVEKMTIDFDNSFGADGSRSLTIKREGELPIILRFARPEAVDELVSIARRCAEENNNIVFNEFDGDTQFDRVKRSRSASDVLRGALRRSSTVSKSPARAITGLGKSIQYESKKTEQILQQLSSGNFELDPIESEARVEASVARAEPAELSSAPPSDVPHQDTYSSIATAVSSPQFDEPSRRTPPPTPAAPNTEQLKGTTSGTQSPPSQSQSAPQAQVVKLKEQEEPLTSRLDEQSLRKRLRRMYAKYAPAEAWKLEPALRKAIENDKREQLMKVIVEKYGKEPDPDEAIDESKLMFDAPPSETCSSATMSPKSSNIVLGSTVRSPLAATYRKEQASVAQSPPRPESIPQSEELREKRLQTQTNPYELKAKPDAELRPRIPDATLDDINQLRLCLREVAALNEEVAYLENQAAAFSPVSRDTRLQRHVEVTTAQERNLTMLVTTICMNQLKKSQDEEFDAATKKLDSLQRQLLYTREE